MSHPSPHQPVDRPGRVFPHKRESAVLALLRAQADACRAQPCQMEAYFNTMRDSPFGGPRVAHLSCNCPRCSGRVSL